MALRHFLSVLRARWRFIVTTIGLGMLMTVGITLVTPPAFESKASLFVSSPNNGVIDPYSAAVVVQQRAQSYANLAVSPDVLQQAAERLGNGMTAAQLSEQVSTSVAVNTSVLDVQVLADSAQEAQDIATVMCEEVIRLVKNIEAPGDRAPTAPIIARVASKPSYDRLAVVPNIPFNLAVGLTLSLLVGVSGAMIRDFLDSSIEGIDDIEDITGHAPIGTLPFDPTIKDYPLGADVTGSPLSEAFRVLRTNLQFSSLDAKHQTIVVTSSVPDEGKTFAATNLAITIAKGGLSVLLVDADLRNPNVAKLLGLENSVGLITILLGRASIAQATQHHASGVAFVGTGPQPPNPAEVLDTRAMRELIAQMGQNYDVVVIDASPLLPVADAAILLTQVDGALLLTRYGSTHREQLRLALARIEAVGGKLIGTVLNWTPARGTSRYGYGYGYGQEFGTSGANVRDRRVGARTAVGRRARR